MLYEFCTLVQTVATFIVAHQMLFVYCALNSAASEGLFTI